MNLGNYYVIRWLMISLFSISSYFYFLVFFLESDFLLFLSFDLEVLSFLPLAPLSFFPPAFFPLFLVYATGISTITIMRTIFATP